MTERQVPRMRIYLRNLRVRSGHLETRNLTTTMKRCWMRVKQHPSDRERWSWYFVAADIQCLWRAGLRDTCDAHGRWLHSTEDVCAMYSWTQSVETRKMTLQDSWSKLVWRSWSDNETNDQLLNSVHTRSKYLHYSKNQRQSLNVTQFAFENWTWTRHSHFDKVRDR